jgi:acyl-CoA synthetase (AMP-forming)/AMP-acid ligase II
VAPLTLWSLIERRATTTPDATMALDERARTLTYAEYRDACEQRARSLVARHRVQPGHVVSWQLGTSIDAMVVLGALARLGAVQNPLLPIYGTREVDFITAQAGTRVFLTEADAGDDTDSDVDLPPPPSSDDEVRWLYYTSGTTGEPKGVRHTDASVIAGGRSLAEGLHVTGDDREALVFPFAHIGGAVWLVTGLLTGCTHLVVAKFDPASTIDFLAANGVTLAGAGTPFHLSYLAQQRARAGTPVFPAVRAFPGGASPKPPALHAELRDELGGVGVLSAWGLTEAPILTCNSPGDPDDQLATSEGRPGPGVDIRVADDGELQVRGPQVFAGYVDASLDAAAFTDDGWLRTGDLGRLDAHGAVVITGRLKDVIIRKGENISAKEVEDVLYRHPAVADVAVIGLPDDEVGERCCAVVAPATDALHAPPTLEDLTAFLAEEGLMKQKWPERVEIVDALPRNVAGKVLKHELRDRYAR